MEKIKVNNLKKSYGDLEVLKSMDLQVQEGEVVCLIGPSGSDKSTLLRCLNLLEEVTGGEVSVNEVNLTDKGTNINKVRENIGMVFQHFNLFPHLTILDNIWSVELKKATKEQAKEKALELLKRVGLQDKASAKPEQLSWWSKAKGCDCTCPCHEP